VAQATGDIVALTIPACVAGPEWIARVVEAHRSPHAGIGGAIDLAPGAGLTTAAIFFVRYTSYMQPFSEGPVTDVPGDNGSYKRAAIAAHLPSIEARGFWETEINARLRETGKTLWMDPGLGVTFEGGYSVAGFSRQRYRHGLVFGREKAARLGAEPRALHVLAAPLVPPLMLARIVSTLLRKRRHLGRFAVALPLVSWFLVCWAAGEAAGLASSPARG
jgi:hypothetical protein